MPHLHLPIDHSDADLVLAANVAEVVGSADLYVAWSHESGPGAVPEVEAIVREERPARPFSEVLLSLAAGVVALWHSLFGGRGGGDQRPAPTADRPRAEA
jgi:hypothetical protein